uniref:Tumor necrosis factor ligand superfamily member 14 n=1 Tax=Fundulus heteroclitus TaxID=8078 RepID=A0A3Q2QLJ9_FUNHE
MAEGGTAPPPQVFVVDTQASYISTPRDKKSSWARAGQKILFLLLGLLVLGVLVEGYLIYILYQRTASFSHCGSNMPCRNLTHTLGSENQVIYVPIQVLGFCRLVSGSEHPVGDNNVVLWNSLAQHDSVNIEYNNGRLIIKEEGHYYVYSRVELDVSKDTTPIFHKIMKTSSGYGKEIELLKATSSHCVHKNPANCAAEDIRSSFLAGIFHLQEDDKIFVTLSNVEKLHRSANGNSLGAFMIEP